MTKQKIQAIFDFIEAADKSINAAKKILITIWNEKDLKAPLDFDINGLYAYKDDDVKIVEWVFTWIDMLGADWNIYPVPQNYASKSMMVQWSRLKAIISSNWKINYKIIKEMPYKTIKAILAKEWDNFQAITWWKVFNLLVAPISFMKANIWDTIAIRIPENKDATYAALESVIHEDKKLK